MNTPPHFVLNLALLKRTKLNLFMPVAIGSVLPDAEMFLFYGYQKVIGTPENTIWPEKYYEPGWLSFFWRI